MMIEARPIPDDLSWVRLRPADEAECAVGGYTAEEAIRVSCENAIEAHMVCVDEVPVAFWGYGCASLLSPIAYGWMLTLPAIDSHGRLLARASRRVVEYILERYPLLVVQTHCKHVAAVRWLEWLGFEAYAPHGPFELMVKRRA